MRQCIASKAFYYWSVVFFPFLLLLSVNSHSRLPGAFPFGQVLTFTLIGCKNTRQNGQYLLYFSEPQEFASDIVEFQWHFTSGTTHHSGQDY